MPPQIAMFSEPLLLLYHDEADKTRIETPPLLQMTPISVVQPYILLLAKSRPLPRFISMKEYMLHAFLHVVFRKSIWVVKYRGDFACFEIFLRTCQLEGSFLNDFDPKTKVFDTDLFSHNNIADLSSGKTFVLLSQKKPLRLNEMKTNTCCNFTTLILSSRQHSGYLHLITFKIILTIFSRSLAIAGKYLFKVKYQVITKISMLNNLKINKLFWLIHRTNGFTIFWRFHCTKKWSFPVRISSVNVTKYAVSYGFGHIYWRNAKWKTSSFVQY